MMGKFLAKVVVTLKPSILDVQGRTVENSLKTIGFSQINNIRVGKYITFTVDANTIEEARKIADNATDTLLFNPNIETYNLEVVEMETGDRR
ncbi:MAG: phosphoribosylformylglycinamidine synthase subunit PurS [Ignavibacteria bacterium]|nr:phosphoribosylformylglycinamidine synthase subunit PurS [Ignavibacteria bacterium]